jgi:small-conductance mechanosensitive channel
VRTRLERAAIVSVVALVLFFAWSASGEPDAAEPDASEEVMYGPPLPPPPVSASVPAPSASVPPVVSAPPPAASVAPAPSASAPAPIQAAPSASAKAGHDGDVTLSDTVVFTLKVGYGGVTAKERADAATSALTEAVKSSKPEDVRVEERGDVFIVYAGTILIVQLHKEDAPSDASLPDHAASVASKVREAIRKEQKRSAIATTVFSFSLAVLFALITLYLLRKFRDFSTRAREWFEKNPDRIPAIQIYSLEVVRPAALRSGISIALTATRWVGQFALVYFWLLATLSLFESTRGYTEKLSGIVLSPLSGLVSRTVMSLPLVLVTLIAAVAVFVLQRFVQLFFVGVSRGETKIDWLPTELAEPTSLLLRGVIVVGALTFAAPIVTGDSEGALAKTGGVVLIALGIACTPLLASVLVGVSVIYPGRLKVGDWAEIGERSGRVRSIGLLETRLEAMDGTEIRIPHLLSLVQPTRLLGVAPRVSVEIAVAPDVDHADVCVRLTEAMGAVGVRPEAEILRVDADGALYRLSVASDAQNARAKLQLAAIDALSAAKIALGRRGPRTP